MESYFKPKIVYSNCSFCTRKIYRFGCKNGDFTPKKKMKLETNSDTHHQALHEALSSKDCGTVCHLLENGEKLCSTDGIENCFILITKFYNIECLEKALSSQPSAIHCRGPQGQTLLMYAKNFNILKTLFKFKPDVNACNDSGENVLIHLIQECTHNYENKTVPLGTYFLMVEYVLTRDININATNSVGRSAIEYYLDLLDDLKPSGCLYATQKQTAELFEKLLKAGAILPRTDALGRTSPMNVARYANLPNFFKIIIDLLRQGVDPKAVDNDGHNLMFHVMSSYQEGDSDSTYHHFFSMFGHEYIEKMSDQCVTLVHYGCELGGLDIDFDKLSSLSSLGFGSMNYYNKKVNFNTLSMMLHFVPFSGFVRELPELNLTLTKSETSLSELTCYFLEYFKWPMDIETFEMVDATVTHLLASGVNVMQQEIDRLGLENVSDDGLEIRNKLPDALWLAAQIMLRVAVNIQEKKVMKAYHIACKILVSLLRFWPYPPLMLLLFKICFSNFEHESSESEVVCIMTMLKFLTRVGGRLPRGSQLFKSLKKHMETQAYADAKDPKTPSQLFNKLHEGIPSLKELCRTAVRATLSKITTSGLDLTSLRVLCQGELREVPRQIQDYLNFNDQPLFCEEDLAEFEGNYVSRQRPRNRFDRNSSSESEPDYFGGYRDGYYLDSDDSIYTEHSGTCFDSDY